MIVCKIYVDVIDGEECIVSELAKRNFPEDVYPSADVPSTYVAISKEAKDLIYKIIRKDGDWEPDIFSPDFIFEVSDYKNNIGMFGFNIRVFDFLPGAQKENDQHRKVYYVNKGPMLVDTDRLWLPIMDSMQVCDNEFLKNLDLTEPVEL